MSDSRTFTVTVPISREIIDTLSKGAWTEERLAELIGDRLAAGFERARKEWVQREVDFLLSGEAE